MARILNKHLMALAAAMALTCGQAYAGEAVTMNLEEAMAKAFANNPAITMANYDLDAAQADLNAARSSRYLSISGQHSSGRSGYDEARLVVIDTLPVMTKSIGNAHSNTLTASLPLYTGGKLKGAVISAKAGFKSAEAGLQATYNKMRSTVTNGYFGVLEADDMQQLARESVARLTDHLKNVRAQYDVGVVAKADVLRSEVELANAQQKLIQAEHAYQLAEAQLNRIVGLPLDTSLKLEDSLAYVAYDKTLEDCLAYAAANRPELEQARQGVQAAKGSLKMALSGHMPQIAARASQSWSDKNWPGDENGNWAVGVNVSMNIFDSGVTLSKIHGAEAKMDKAKESLRDTTDAVMLDVRSNYLGMQEAEKRINTTKAAVALAEEDYRIAQVRYQAGVGTNTDVLDAQVALTQAQTNYLQAMYSYNTSKTNLLTAIGEPMTVPVQVKAAQ